jgi:hypothetical protein
MLNEEYPFAHRHRRAHSHLFLQVHASGEEEGTLLRHVYRLKESLL